MSDRAKSVSPLEVATNWLHTFETALVAEDMKAVAEMFLLDGHWRDLVAFTWHIRTVAAKP